MPDENNSKLGILDWGIGGISIYKLLKSKLGNIPVIYLSDTGATPYGKMSRTELISRLYTVINFLSLHGVTHLAIGCNAASTAIPFLEAKGIEILGVIDSAVSLAARTNPEKLALIGGRRTVLSGIYRRKFAARGIGVAQRIAQPLSALIESGDTSSPKLRTEVKKIIAPIRNCSHLLLACTHYPAINQVFKEFLPTSTVLLDPAAEMVGKIAEWNLPKGGSDVFYTTGDPEAMKRAAQNAFEVSIAQIRRIKL